MTRTLDDLHDYFSAIPTDTDAETRLRRFAADLANPNSTDVEPSALAEIRLVPTSGIEATPHRIRRSWLLPAVAAAVIIAAVGTTVAIDHPGNARPGTPAASATNGPTDLPAPLVPADPTPADYPMSFAYLPKGWTPTSWADGHVVLTNSSTMETMTITLIRGSQPKAVDTDNVRSTTLEIVPAYPVQIVGRGQPLSVTPGQIGSAEEIQIAREPADGAMTVLITRPAGFIWDTDVVRYLFDGITTRPGAATEPSKSLGVDWNVGPSGTPTN